MLAPVAADHCMEPWIFDEVVEMDRHVILGAEDVQQQLRVAGRGYGVPVIGGIEIDDVRARAAG
jgi:hypothetical protein